MSSTGKEPRAFDSAEVIAILNGASTVTGDDFPRAFRVMKEIKGLEEYKFDKKTGASLTIKDEIFLHLKASDLAPIWKWVKAFYIGDGKRLNPAVLEGLEEIAGKLLQGADYAAVVAEMTDESDEDEAKAEEEKPNAGPEATHI